jgi:hypothetical protein
VHPPNRSRSLSFSHPGDLLGCAGTCGPGEAPLSLKRCNDYNDTVGKFIKIWRPMDNASNNLFVFTTDEATANFEEEITLSQHAVSASVNCGAYICHAQSPTN